MKAAVLRDAAEELRKPPLELKGLRNEGLQPRIVRRCEIALWEERALEKVPIELQEEWRSHGSEEWIQWAEQRSRPNSAPTKTLARSQSAGSPKCDRPSTAVRSQADKKKAALAAKEATSKAAV